MGHNQITWYAALRGCLQDGRSFALQQFRHRLLDLLQLHNVLVNTGLDLLDPCDGLFCLGFHVLPQSLAARGDQSLHVLDNLPEQIGWMYVFERSTDRARRVVGPAKWEVQRFSVGDSTSRWWNSGYQVQ